MTDPEITILTLGQRISFGGRDFILAEWIPEEKFSEVVGNNQTSAILMLKVNEGRGLGSAPKILPKVIA